MIRIIGKDKQKKYFQGALDRIRNLQDKDGSIPWFEDGSFDAWNHLESLMALNIFNYEKEVKQAKKKYSFKINYIKSITDPNSKILLIENIKKK